MKRLSKDDRPSPDRFNNAALTRLRWEGPLKEDCERALTPREEAWFKMMSRIGLITPFQGMCPVRGQLSLFEEVP